MARDPTVQASQEYLYHVSEVAVPARSGSGHDLCGERRIRVHTLAAPVVIAMFLAEFSLAVISRFAPQIQVFVLAMPIKSIIAMFILVFYFGVLLPRLSSEIPTAIRFDQRIQRAFNPAPPR